MTPPPAGGTSERGVCSRRGGGWFLAGGLVLRTFQLACAAMRSADGGGLRWPGMCRGGISLEAGGTRCVPGRLYLGGWSPLCTGAEPDGSLGEGEDDGGCRMFLRVLLLLRRW